MSAPKVTGVVDGSPAAGVGVAVGDELISVNGRQPRDVIEYQQLIDEAQVALVLRRSGIALDRRVVITKDPGAPLGLQVESAVFDRVRTCDNHCAFCFIHQLPKSMRKSLYLKDDDYRLSFLYGNFTTLTRFTELDAERVITERLGPLFVSIHATDPVVRAGLLRNPRGATSLKWLRVLLDADIEVHGQIVVCPGINDGDVLLDTLASVIDVYPKLATLGVVPLGISQYTTAPELRAHSVAEAAAVVDAVEQFQSIYLSVLGRRLAFVSDEYYLLAQRPFPSAESYDGFPQHENGIGMARAFEAALNGDDDAAFGIKPGFFAWVDGAPPEGYRAPRAELVTTDAAGPVTVVTGSYGARVLGPMLAQYGFADVRILEVENTFFGGNIGVAGLLTGFDLCRVLATESGPGRYLLPDACLNNGRFLDELTPADLPRPVEIVATDGASLRRALEGRQQLVATGG